MSEWAGVAVWSGRVMNDVSNGNGHWDVHLFKDFQEQRFGYLESVLKEGRIVKRKKIKEAGHPFLTTYC
jgi:hypothetical protein